MSGKKDIFEESLEKLRDAASKINDEGTSLEDSIKYYEEGMKYYAECDEILKRAEQKIEIIDAEASGE